VFSVVRAVLVFTQWCCKHIPAAVNQHATIQDEVFPVEATPKLYNKALRQLRDRIKGVEN
jgi:hypothetical protein